MASNVNTQADVDALYTSLLSPGADPQRRMAAEMLIRAVDKHGANMVPLPSSVDRALRVAGIDGPGARSLVGWRILVPALRGLASMGQFL